MRINQTAALFEQATISRVLLNFIKQSLVGKLAFSKSCAIHGVFNSGATASAIFSTLINTTLSRCKKSHSDHTCFRNEKEFLSLNYLPSHIIEFIQSHVFYSRLYGHRATGHMPTPHYHRSRQPRQQRQAYQVPQPSNSSSPRHHPQRPARTSRSTLRCSSRPPASAKKRHSQRLHLGHTHVVPAAYAYLLPTRISHPLV